jgi:hypothetical protein
MFAFSVGETVIVAELEAQKQKQKEIQPFLLFQLLILTVITSNKFILCQNPDFK